MIVQVYLRDGRTAFRFGSRGDLRTALAAKAGEENQPILVLANFDTQNADATWRPLRIFSLNSNTLAYEFNGEDVDAPEVPDG